MSALTLLRRTMSPLVGPAASSGARQSSRTTFEALTAGADAEQLEFMKEMIVQVDEHDTVLGPITKKDGACLPCSKRARGDSTKHQSLR